MKKEGGNHKRYSVSGFYIGSNRASNIAKLLNEKFINNKLERNICICIKEENCAPISVKPAEIETESMV